MSKNPDGSSVLTGGNSAYLEELFAKFKASPRALDPSWRAFFEDVSNEVNGAALSTPQASWARDDWPIPPNGDLIAALDIGTPAHGGEDAAPPPPSADILVQAARDSIGALNLIRAYRMRGHLIAELDPLGLMERTPHPELDPASYGFGAEDLDRSIFINEIFGLEFATIPEIIGHLTRIYCGTIGVEYMHIDVPAEKEWIRGHIEGTDDTIRFTPEGKRAILQKLTEAGAYEQYLDKKYTGTKRFGLDGGETLVPAMEAIIKTGGQTGVEEIVIGMSHRGRLNILANVMLKPFRAIFHEFHGGSSSPEQVQGGGDVKYHLGTSADRDFDGNLVHLSLVANPSHLEAVDPVVLGKVRAKQVQRKDETGEQVLGVLLHGDAAFSGQGLVAECLGLSGLKGYETGGTVHFIVNNQIGFTTKPHASRSSPYPSDVAKMVQAPIFHVNGDDPEAVVHVTKIATLYRQKFHKDVVIDMFCYRRAGHNEGDEPFFTQPVMYKAIAAHPTIREIYAQKLAQENIVSTAESEKIYADFQAVLDTEFAAAEKYKAGKADWLEGQWAGLRSGLGKYQRGRTDCTLSQLKSVGAVLTAVPERVQLHRGIQRFIKNRKKMFETSAGFDWATAEALAFGTLLEEGFPIRLSGQDSTRGTFSQRHLAFIDQETEEAFVPLAGLGKPGDFEVLDSMLSEAGVLGFEYGYSSAEPQALIMWEAQFGDFANGAQVIVDQFLASAEGKWLRMSGLVMLLPHGYEGQGPEHSSARIERYLQLCADDNLQICNCTTPANYFHVLRRQMHRKFRKPLIIFTPKSLLRHKRAVSKLSEMGPKSSFHRILWDDAETDPGSVEIKIKENGKIRRVVLCSGKVYYDLFEERNRRGLDDVYLLRIEQLYPLDVEVLGNELARFPKADVIWCQEEPRNMGAWSFIEPSIEEALSKTRGKGHRAIYAGRPASASTATGLMSRHLSQQKALVSEALG